MSTQPSDVSQSRNEERYTRAVHYHRVGRLDEAERLYREILAAIPHHADSLHLLGVLALDAGKVGEALELIDQALEISPCHVAARMSLGNALLRSNRVADAVTAYERVVELKPDLAEGYFNLGNALQLLGRLQDAVDAYNTSLRLKPDYAKAYNNLGNALRTLGRMEEALETYDLAISRRTIGFEAALENKALLLKALGRVAESLQTTDEALAFDPNSVAAWHIRVQLKKFAPADAEIDAMEAVLAGREQRLCLEDRARLRFALGKACLDAGDAERAFAHLSEGNRLKRSALTYDSEATARGILEIARTFTPDLMARLAGAGDPTQAPVFIVGMPRSGTTLVEQILASHPEVHGAGELTLLRDVVGGVSVSAPEGPADYSRLLAQLEPRDLAFLGSRYAERLCALAPGKRRVIDKEPLNFLYCGLIHLILPNARIVHCRRNAVDTCLSCYTKPFVGELGFTYDLRELGLYYRRYEMLMAHWRTLLPPACFIEVDYEALVEDLEGEGRRLLGFCGLEWHEACLAFHQTRRHILTASATQVREPLYRTSVGRWKSYARYLEPLLGALEESDD
jgi:tetratricopeptide (TPR) repeat protein